jgi:hypothetical protein
MTLDSELGGMEASTYLVSTFKAKAPPPSVLTASSPATVLLTPCLHQPTQLRPAFCTTTRPRVPALWNGTLQPPGFLLPVHWSP